ncbi:MAG: flagellar brake protein [Nitrospira sp.]|nr:flagellar brake protein [Nitrospira sp.]
MREYESSGAYLPILRVGLSLQLSIDTGGGTLQGSAVLLGWKAGAWLMCEWPVSSGPVQISEPGARCLVQYVVAGKLIGYESVVHAVQTDPVPLLFLAFPRTVEAIHLRKHVRVPSNEPLFLIRVDGMGVRSTDSYGNAAMGGLVEDLSVSGCRVTLQQPRPQLQPGSLVQLEFELLGIGHISHLTGVVRSVEDREQTKSLGIEFRFGRKEYIEYRGWGGSVQNALEHAVMQKRQALGMESPDASS